MADGKKNESSLIENSNSGTFAVDLFNKISFKMTRFPFGMASLSICNRFRWSKVNLSLNNRFKTSL